MINLGFPQSPYASTYQVAGFGYSTSPPSYVMPPKPYGMASSARKVSFSYPPVGSWGKVYPKPTPPIRQPEGVNALIGNKTFKTLTTALGSAGLVDAVKRLDIKNPITVLAPTNAAFGKLDPKLLQSLLKPENKAFLQQVLQYHVSDMKFPLAQQSGRIGFDSLLSNNQDDTVISKLNGRRLSIKNGAQNINGSRPIVASNGSTIIPVDQVLIPPEFDVNALNADKKSAVSFVSTNKNTATLFAAIKAADLGGAVAGLENSRKSVTILAPSEAAFKKLDPKLLEALLKPENKSVLQQILQYHVSATKLKNGAFDSLLETDQTQLARAQNGQTVVVNGRQVIKASNPVQTANGSKIFTIDEVLIPPGLDVASLLIAPPAPPVYGLPLVM
jgi:uncharacterized surface protein with fasciclin (FAS1) repeats